MESKLTVKELAKVLGVSKRTIERRLEKPDCGIPYYQIGRRKYFYLSEVLQATKITPVDKREVVEKLEFIYKNLRCKTGGLEICVSDRIKDVIDFINSTNRNKEKG